MKSLVMAGLALLSGYFLYGADKAGSIVREEYDNPGIGPRPSVRNLVNTGDGYGYLLHSIAISPDGNGYDSSRVVFMDKDMNITQAFHNRLGPFNEIAFQDNEFRAVSFDSYRVTLCSYDKNNGNIRDTSIILHRLAEKVSLIDNDMYFFTVKALDGEAAQVFVNRMDWNLKQVTTKEIYQVEENKEEILFYYGCGIVKGSDNNLYGVLSITDHFKKTTIKIFRFDTDLNMTGHFSYEEKAGHILSGNLLSDKDRNLVFLSIDVKQGSASYPLTLNRFNTSEMKIGKRQTYVCDDIWWTDGAAIIQDPDGNYVVAGNRRDESTEEAYDPFIAKFDSEFELMKEFTWGTWGVKETVLTMVPAGPGRYLVGGTKGDTAGYLALVDLQANTVEEKITGAEVFPNPVSDVLHLGAIEGSNISFFDTSGKRVFPLPTDTYSFDVSALPAGAYTVIIEKGSSRASRKFVKK